MKVQDIGQIVSKRRKELKLSQADLSITSGTGLRFIGDLERGKETCQIGKILKVLATLGIKIELNYPN